MFISLDLMLLLDKTKSHVNLYLVIALVDTRHIWKLGKKSPAQLSLAIKLCSLALCFDLQIASLLIPNLVTILVCIPLLHNACSYDPIYAPKISLWVCDQ